MKIIKLTVKESCTIRAGSSPDVPVNETISIPPFHKGEFYIRKRLGNKGINVPSANFPSGWVGTPQICLIHTGANDEDLVAGDEIGELHISYAEPSPLQGKHIVLPDTFGFRKKDGKFEVATSEGKLYTCSMLYPSCYDDKRFSIVDCPEEWNVVQTGPFMANYIMDDYTLQRYLTEEESTDLIKLLVQHTFKSALNQTADIFKNNPELKQQLDESLVKVPKQGKLDDHQKHTHVGEQLKGLTTQPASLDPTCTLCTSFKVTRPFKYTNDGKLIQVWLGGKKICSASEFTISFNGRNEGFVYHASERAIAETPLYVTPNKLGADYCIALVNPVYDDSTYSFLVQPPISSIAEFGQFGAFIYGNLPTLMKNADLLGPKHKSFLTFFVKGLIKQRLLKDAVGDVRSLTSALQHLRAARSPHAVKFADVVKRKDCSWTSPLKTMDELHNEYPHYLVSILLGKLVS